MKNNIATTAKQRVVRATAQSIYSFTVYSHNHICTSTSRAASGVNWNFEWGGFWMGASAGEFFESLIRIILLEDLTITLNSAEKIPTFE